MVKTVIKLALASIRKIGDNRVFFFPYQNAEKQTKLQTDASDKTIKTMVFQQKKPLDYYSQKLTPTETNYTTGDKKDICGGYNIETLAAFNTKNKT